MLQNKIYQYFGKEIVKTFFVILIGFTAITWTVKAVNFLELIIESGYSVLTYFNYTILNIFGIITKFIPLAFLIALIIFILKEIQENEFIILWTVGVKKTAIINFLFLISILVLIFSLLLSVFFSPLALNKSRQLLNNNELNSLLPVLRTQQFTDSFKGLTLFIEKKVNNEIKNVFIHDEANTLKNFTSNKSKYNSTTIVSPGGIVTNNNLILFDGKIISTNDDKENNLIKFNQLNINLNKFENSTIKVPKLQETATSELLKCIIQNSFNGYFCNENLKKEIIPILNRRIVYPFYLPLISLVCCLLLIKNNKKILYNKYSVFIMCFILLLLIELIIRFTGINKSLSFLFIFFPIVLTPVLYVFLRHKFSKESELS
jgi:lipopolysaccharide export LptBFGC system permease protein LptF